MRNTKYIEVPYGNQAVLRINRKNIVATLSSTDSKHIDIYTTDTVNPFHVPEEYCTEEILNDIWFGDELATKELFEELGVQL